jgi:RND family efflux transporter MFP subunit
MLKLLKSVTKLPRRYFLLAFVALSIGGWFFWSQSSNVEDPILISAERKDIRTTVSASGTLQGKQSTNLHFKSSGKLAYLPIKVGQTVSRFQTIAGLDSQDLSASLQQAQNDYRAKQASAEKALDDVKDHKTDETFTQKETRTKAEATRDSAYDALKIAQFALNNSYIPSPFNGVITEVNFQPGQFVSTSDAIARVVDWSEVIFEAEVDEADISQVEVGQTADVELNSYPGQIFPGKVSEISSSTKTNSSGATVVVVKINLGAPNIKLISDLNGQVNITISEKKNALSLPNEVIVDDSTVYIQENGKVVPIKVTTGARDDQFVEVTNGLTEQQKVIKNPQRTL